MIKKCGTCGIKYQHCNSFFENTNFKYDLIEFICLCYNKKYQQKVKETFLIHVNFLTMITISLFYCYESFFSLWIYGWLGKTQWNIITLKRSFLLSVKCGRYHWHRLCAHKNTL